jgi:hypothetical protein
MIVDISITAHIKNQLICIMTPAINVFLIIFNGFHLSPADHIILKIFLTTAYTTKNHKAKLAKFFIIFHNVHKLASKCKNEP